MEVLVKLTHRKYNRSILAPPGSESGGFIIEACRLEFIRHPYLLFVYILLLFVPFRPCPLYVRPVAVTFSVSSAQTDPRLFGVINVE